MAAELRCSLHIQLMFEQGGCQGLHTGQQEAGSLPSTFARFVCLRWSRVCLSLKAASGPMAGQQLESCCMVALRRQLACGLQMLHLGHTVCCAGAQALGTQMCHFFHSVG